MKRIRIGILTLHSQLNYGGVLQCWALQTAIEKLKYDVVVLDRWLDAGNTCLERGIAKRGLRGYLSNCIRSLFGVGDRQMRLRAKTTKCFIEDYLKLTGYHFVSWEDAPESLGVDIIVVGSDQVWHCGDFGDPRVYLLQGAPHIPAIAYAASFGFGKLPQNLSDMEDEKINALPIYKEGLARFSAISCREEEGVMLCKELGFHAEHVLDPTLLLDEADWFKIVKVEPSKRKRIVCYFMSEDISSSITALADFAKGGEYDVIVLLNSGMPIPFPSTLSKFKRWRFLQACKYKQFINIIESAGPKEFAEAIANADFVISDSFHALMLSISFGKNVRILKPKTEMRRRMISRMREIAKHIRGEIFAESVAAALSSYDRHEVVEMDREWLSKRLDESLKFLKENLKVG